MQPRAYVASHHRVPGIRTRSTASNSSLIATCCEQEAQQHSAAVARPCRRRHGGRGAGHGRHPVCRQCRCALSKWLFAAKVTPVVRRLVMCRSGCHGWRSFRPHLLACKALACIPAASPCSGVSRKPCAPCSRAGDSRCVMCRDGEAVAMTEDHKPTDAAENERITKARRRRFHREAEVAHASAWVICDQSWLRALP